MKSDQIQINPEDNNPDNNNRDNNNRVVARLINRGANNPVVVLQTNPDSREENSPEEEDLHLHWEFHRVLFTSSREATPHYRMVVGSVVEKSMTPKDR